MIDESKMVIYEKIEPEGLNQENDPEPSSSPEIIEVPKDFDDRLTEALTSAPTEKECLGLRNRISKLLTDYLEKRINGKEYGARVDEIWSENGVLRCKDFDEFRIALTIFGIEKDIIDRDIEHEKEHYEENLKNGRNPQILIHFFRRHEDGEPDGFHPAIECEESIDVDDDKSRKLIIKGIEVVKEPSDTDQEVINIKK